MNIVFDPRKDRINIKKHGISLARDSDLDLETAVVIADTREDYGEERWFILGFIGAAIHGLVATFPDPDTMRAISLRRAKPQERIIYAENKSP